VCVCTVITTYVNSERKHRQRRQSTSKTTTVILSPPLLQRRGMKKGWRKGDCGRGVCVHTEINSATNQASPTLSSNIAKKCREEGGTLIKKGLQIRLS